ncbi:MULTISPECIES: P-loop NTPase fold protein [unclassified Sphingomonas]|uniref:P-loop NTPase fold protein n=1 Tax=unclassified Sphingomonas TaxID=196159 RepID=UPI00226ADFC2|nr:MULTISPECIES: P-loop NTPase fold protein [unclassified Sphingomonas]
MGSNNDNGALKLIIDEPAENDFFKTHGHLADAITSSIIGNASLRVVGLLGRWGSGKSTIVKAVSTRLTARDSKYLLFNYDAWLHQHDPLRRSFLESIAEFLWQEGAIEPVKWRKKLALLSGGVEVVDRLETPTVTGEAKLFFALTVIVSLGLFLAKDTFKEALKPVFEPVSLWGFRLALLMMFGPPFGWLLRWAWLASTGSSRAFFPGVLLNKEISHTNIVTQKPPEPTSIEFGREFRAMMQDAAASGHRVVIVLDNIDRLEEGEALKIWASIRSFFLGTSTDNAAATETYHPLVILPMDAASITNMFAVGSNSQTGERLASSFINKTFDVTFEVPVPVMSDWKSYLKSQMSFALGDQFDDQKFFATRIFMEDWFKEGKTPVTPREINKKLNTIVALLLQYKEPSIQFESVAFFAINRATIDSNIVRAISGSNALLARFVEDWRRQIAALHFGVDVAHAAQILMSEPVRRAFETGDGSAIEPYHQVSGLEDIVEATIASLFESEFDNASKFGLLVNAIGVLHSIPHDPASIGLANGWKGLVNLYAGLDKFQNVNEFATRIKRLATFVEAHQAVGFVEACQRLVDTLISADEVTLPSVGNAATVGEVALSVAANFGLSAPQFNHLGDAAAYLGRLHLLRDHSSVQVRLRTSNAHAEIVTALAARLGAQPTASTVPSLIKLLTSPASTLMLGGELEGVEAVVATAEQQARENSGDSVLFRAAVSVLTASPKLTVLGRLAVEKLVKDQTLATQFPAVVASGDWVAVANMIAAAVWRPMLVSPPNGVAWGELFSKRPDLGSSVNRQIDILCDRSESAIDRILLLHSSVPRMRTLATLLLESRVRAGKLGDIFVDKTIRDLPKFLNIIDWRLRDNFVELVADNYSGFFEEVNTSPWSEGLFETGKRLRARGGLPSEKFEAAVVSRFASTAADDWIKAILTGLEPYRLATHLVGEGGGRLPTGSGLYDALAQAAQLIEIKSRPVMMRWFELAELLTSSARRKALDKLWGAFKGLPAADKLSLFAVGGNRIVANGKLFLSGSALRDLIIPLSKSKAGRTWLTERRLDVRRAISNLDPDSLVELQGVFATLSKSKEEATRDWAKNANKTFHLVKLAAEGRGDAGASSATIDKG